MTSLNKLLQDWKDFVRKRDWEKYHCPKNLAIDLVGEATEVLEHFRWLTDQESKDLPPQEIAKIKDEIGDVMRVLVYLSALLGIDPMQAAFDKMEKLEYQYPQELSKGKSAKYTAYQTPKECKPEVKKLSKSG